MNLATFARDRAQRYGSRVLADIEGEPITYAELAERASRVSAGLQALGIGRGDRVAVMMGTRPEFLYAWFGILGVGAIEVPIHDAARGPGIAYILETTGARALVVDDEHAGHVEGYTGSVEHVIRVPEAMEEFLAREDGVAPVELEPRDPASILFTGGTTGPPKGVVLPHNHNFNLSQGIVEVVGYTEDDVLYSVFPLFHANAKYVTLVAAMIAGAKVVMHKRFSASRFWDICRREGITAFNGQGEMLKILLKQPERDGDRDNSVRVVVGAAASAELVEAFEQRFDLAVLDVYGMTETGPTLAARWDKRRAGSCGVPTPSYEVKIVDEHDNDVPDGVKGEIVVRPRRPHVMMERYWGNDAATLGAMRNLWFHTGDNATRDEDASTGSASAARTPSGGGARTSRPGRSSGCSPRIPTSPRRRSSASRRSSAGRRSWSPRSCGPTPSSRRRTCWTSARARCRTSPCRGTSGSWTSSRSPTPSASSSRSSRRQAPTRPGHGTGRP